MGRIEKLAIAMAWIGGALLLGLMALISVSVIGRGLGDLGLGWAGPVRGDFELVEAGMGVAIFAFLPLCHLRAGHARVDLLARALPGAAQRGLALFWEAIFCLALGVITWRLGAATLEKSCILAQMRGDWCSLETSFRLGMPIWWPYLASLAAAAIATLTAAACTLYRARHGSLPARPRFEEAP